MTVIPRPRLAEILLVEDQEPDVELVREALADSQLANRLHHVQNGREALKFMRRQGSHADSPRPDLILLDLNMPIMSGREMLAEMHQDPQLNAIPVVVMTSSDREEDVVESYAQCANCYVKKPIDLEEFRKIVASIENFWFGIVTLPGAVAS